MIRVEYKEESIVTESHDGACSVLYVPSCWYTQVIQLVGDQMYISWLDEGNGRYGR